MTFADFAFATDDYRVDTQLPAMESQLIEASELGDKPQAFGLPRCFVTVATVAIVGLIAGLPTTFAELPPPVKLAPSIEQLETARAEVVARAIPTATSIFVPGGGGGGSGVVIDPDGYALTNFHVTSPAGNFMQCSMADGKVYDAVIVGIDPVGDLAMIRLVGRDAFPHAPLGDSSRVQSGDWSMVIGNPFLLAGNLQPTVTWGVISGVGRYQYPSGTLLEYGDCLQTEASVNPGNSGGPIYNDDAEVIGIVGRCSFEKRGRVNVGVGYAISANQAKNFLGTLEVGRIADHATLGATVVTDPEGGVRISNIIAGSDAYRRGLRYDAEILRIDGRTVTTANEVQNVLATYPANWRIPLTFRHDGETVRTVVRLRSVHRRDELLEKMKGSMPPPPPVPDKPKDEDDDTESSPPQDDREPGESIPRDATPGESDDDAEGNAESDAGKKSSSVSDEVKRMFEARRGFANYYFNRLAQQRFINSLRKLAIAPESGGNGAAGASRWTIRGVATTHGDAEVAIEIDPKIAKGVIGDDSALLESGNDAYELVERGGKMAVLAPLSAWLRMTIEGPDRFGDTYAAGSGPLAGARPLRNIIVSTDGESEVRFLTHPDGDHLEVVEVEADRDRDPAELWITLGPDRRPERLELKFGLETRVAIKITQWETSPIDKPVNVDALDPAKE